MKKQSRQIQTRDVEGPFDHIRTYICSPLKITFSAGTSQYKVTICPLHLSKRGWGKVSSEQVPEVVLVDVINAVNLF